VKMGCAGDSPVRLEAGFAGRDACSLEGVAARKEGARGGNHGFPHGQPPP